MIRMTRRSIVLPSLLLAGLLIAGCAPAAPSPTTAPAKPAAAASPTEAPPKPAAIASPSPSPSPSPNPVTTTSDVVPAPSGASVKITAPAAGATVPAGNLRIAFDVNGVTMVPAADARRVEDLHTHVLLDVDPAPYLGTTTFIPLGNPAIVHTAGKEATFENVRPGQHRVTVILTGANHISVQPPVSDSVSFTVN